MAFRFVLIWATLATLGQAAIYWLTMGVLSSTAYSNTELMLLGSYVLMPAGEWSGRRQVESACSSSSRRSNSSGEC